jgi:hypothetical protein
MLILEHGGDLVLYRLYDNYVLWKEPNNVKENGTLRAGVTLEGAQFYIQAYNWNFKYLTPYDKRGLPFLVVTNDGNIAVRTQFSIIPEVFGELWRSNTPSECNRFA